jgi:two-component system cell cycle response regulator
VPATRIFALGAGEKISGMSPAIKNRWITPLALSDEHIRVHRFVLFLTEDTAYAFYARRANGDLRGFHTGDPGLVESLIFKLQKEYALQFQL